MAEDSTALSSDILVTLPVFDTLAFSPVSIWGVSILLVASSNSLLLIWDAELLVISHFTSVSSINSSKIHGFCNHYSRHCICQLCSYHINYSYYFHIPLILLRVPDSIRGKYLRENMLTSTLVSPSDKHCWFVRVVRQIWVYVANISGNYTTILYCDK
ncbi:hypothetical protein RINTHH_15980 [Richelia intracellularis HH01]|uniref:Uncharacterized protein n=1 Tax=Richelia intracellularis HH01 TaxID=1165094 RepID=M1X0X6_9NOST|nr:hypothetical protein RINTHH_15980 [Richelia intracellularis HH01]